MATSTAGLTDSGIRRKSGTRIAQRCKAHKGRSGYGTERRGRNGKELGWWVRGRFCVLPPEISLTVFRMEYRGGWKPHRAGKRESVVRSSLQTWSSRRDSVRQQVIAKRGRCVAAGVMPGACPCRDRCVLNAAHWESALSRSACPHATRESHRGTARQWCSCCRTYGWCRVQRLTERGDEITQLVSAGGAWKGRCPSTLPRMGVQLSGYTRLLREEWSVVPEIGSAQVCGPGRRSAGRRYYYYCEAAKGECSSGRRRARAAGHGWVQIPDVEER